MKTDLLVLLTAFVVISSFSLNQQNGQVDGIHLFIVGEFSGGEEGRIKKG